MATQSAVIDDLDRRILHALQIAPRAGFARMAEVLDVSEQTVARRYQRMRTEGLVRIFGRADPERLAGTTLWTLRIGCRPGTTDSIADALARRPDTSWVSVAAGGAELTCQVEIADADRNLSLLHHLPRATNVLTFSAHQMLHRFVGRGEVDWVAVGHDLTPEQRATLRAGTAAGPEGGRDPDAGRAERGAELRPEDKPLLAALARDGRASFAALASATGWSQRQVAHRVAALTASRALWFDIDASIDPIGFRAVAILWFTVAPRHLEAVGKRLADHPELAFAAATTGSANLLATALCRDADALYRYLTTKIAAIKEVRTLETVPLLNRVKQAHYLVENGRLKDPPT